MLEIFSNTGYEFKIYNPTNVERDFILEYRKGDSVSQIGTQDGINPRENSQIYFLLSEGQDLNYHCAYHPDLIRGTITLIVE